MVLDKLNPKRVVLAAIFIMLLSLLSAGLQQVPQLIAADFPNPDSFYKLVLVSEYSADTGFQYVARDNAPYGTYQHWSAVHSWALYHGHRALQLVGVEKDQALIWAGASITLLSMLALAVMVATLVIRQGSLLAAIVAVIALVSSAPIRAYGQPVQITHHIFMLVPLAAAAAALLPSHTVWRHWHLTALGGGALLALALWISPETMPFVVVLLATRAAFHLQYRTKEVLWPVAAGLCLMLAIAWRLDPPPPTFSVWALDHVSLAWLLFGLLLASLLLLADALVALRVSFVRSLVVLASGVIAAASVWLFTVPGALAGPDGLIPHELKALWWNTIAELQPVTSATEIIAYLALPAISGLMLIYLAVRRRVLWMGVLAASVFAYAFLAARHSRMGAAAGLLAIICYGLALSAMSAFREPARLNGRHREQVLALFFILLPSLQLVLALLLLNEKADEPQNQASASRCRLADVAAALNSLPPGTLLASINDGPEILWRTPHRTIAGNYHHNVQGLLDHFRLWRSTAPDEQAQRLVEQRKIDYVLGCDKVSESMRLNDGQPTLASRVANGASIDWLPRHEKIGRWHLYRRANGAE